MLIDVIIPVFNRSHLVERAIDSVLAQSFKHFNLFIVDDGSTDDFASVLKKYSHDSRVIFLRQENKGVSAARNYGISHSNSEWIALLDSDDEWLPQKLEIQMAFSRKNPEYQFIHSDEIWMRNGVRVNPKKKFDKSNHEIFKRSLETCLISPSTVLMKRELCIKHGCFDESLVICEDYDLWLKILATLEVGYISEFLIKKYGGHDDQLSTKYYAMDFWRLKSLLKLIKSENLSLDQRQWIKDQIELKSNILRAGYIKHQNSQGLNELAEIFKGYQT